MHAARTGRLSWMLLAAACSSAEPGPAADAAVIRADGGTMNAEGDGGDGEHVAEQDGAQPGDGDPSAGDGGPSEPTPPQIGEIDCRSEGDGITTLVFVNRCARPVTFAGSEITGGTLARDAFACVNVGNASDELPTRRYWGWFDADPGLGRYTLAEFTFNTDFHDFDWYNVSHVDAHNLPMSIVPVGRPDCHTLSCPQDFLADCPDVGRVENNGGDLVSCISPMRDDPNSTVALYFEACDDAYAWSGDDQHGTDVSPMRACAGEDWDIVFCPPE